MGRNSGGKFPPDQLSGLVPIKINSRGIKKSRGVAVNPNLKRPALFLDIFRKNGRTESPGDAFLAFILRDQAFFNGGDKALEPGVLAFDLLAHLRLLVGNSLKGQKLIEMLQLG